MNSRRNCHKLLAIDDDSITLGWWVRTCTGTWAPWIVKSVEQTISVSSCTIFCMICECDMKFIQTCYPLIILNSSMQY